MDEDGGGTAGGTTTGGDIILGEGQDAAIWYDGTDLRINPRVVGTGDLDITGDVTPSADATYSLGDTTTSWLMATSPVKSVLMILTVPQAGEELVAPDHGPTLRRIPTQIMQLTLWGLGRRQRLKCMDC